MKTFTVPAEYELLNVTTMHAGVVPYAILHLRNKATGQDELTTISAAQIPTTWVTQ